MKDLKSLYLAAKNSGTPKDISLYTEAVKECLDKDPTNFILNLEYIITSDINLTRLDDFVEKYGISIPAYDKIVECLESCIEKCDKRNIDSSLYKEYLEKYIMFKNDHPNCFAMYEYYSDDQNDDYLSKYYSFNESGVQCRRLPMAMLDRFKVTAIPDLIITAKSFGEGAVDSMIGLLHSKTAMQFNESYNSDMILEQWISECVKDISHNSNISYNYETAESIVESMRSKHKSAYKESVILGDENICFEYSEKELRALQDLITLKEYQVVSYDNPTMAMKTQNEIYSLYEEFDGLINESGEFIKSDDLSSFTELKAAVINTRNKKTGSIPTYLSRNHDMNYGEEDDKPKSDDEHDLSDFERPSAKKSDNDKLDNIEPLGDPDENPDNEDLSSDTSPNPVNNYYYYTYNNSLNKNSNSFNKDNSTHDNHSKHDNSVTNDSSVHNSTRRITDDHSMYKRVHSHDYNGSTYDNEVESESSKPWELGSFLKNNKNQTVMMETGNSKRPINNTYIPESSSYYIDKDSYDKHIKNVWFIKSDDNVDNCCLELQGYPKPMRGRSAMIALSKIDGEWSVLIKKKPSGEWEFPGGGWDKGEQPVDAAERELHEEGQITVKNVQRVGTQIQYSPKKINVSPWVKLHVKDSNDWWYGYYTSIFIGEYSGKFTGHIDEEDFEDTFEWKPLTFIAKKFPKKLIDAIESYISTEFNENVSDDYLSEAVDVSNKKFDRAYKAAWNYDNGHLIKITYSLQGCEVTNVGLSKAMIDHVKSVAEETNKENHRGHKNTKNIRAFMVILKGILSAKKQIPLRKKMLTDFLNKHIGDVGYLDFQAKDCKVIEMYDCYERKPITDEIRIVGVYTARHMESSKSKILNDRDLAKVHNMLENHKTKFHIATHKIGDVEIYPTFMSTYWKDDDDHVLMDLSKKVIDSDQRDTSPDNGLENIPDIIGDLEAKGFHVSDAEVSTFLQKYRSKEKYIPDVLSMESKKNITEAVGDADNLKPESDHPIKDVLTDVDRKLTSKQQQAKKKIQDIQNVGRAFMKPINRTKQWVDNMVSNWKDADETKIKERMADPHARNNLISAITWSIKTGSFVKAGVLLNPLFLFLSITKHVNKNKKEFRLRNEMIGELKMELKIIDEKIKDAAAKGDTKSKYHLMRLKNEINKKLIRVGGGKGWDKML